MMTPRLTLPLLLLALASPAACAAERLPTVALPPEIARVLGDYARAWEARDLSALAQLFAPEGLALPNGQPPARGADRIRRAYAASAGGPLFLRPLAHAASADLAYVIGGFSVSADGPDAGKFTLVLRRDREGRWLIVADMDNADVPMQPVPPSRPAD